MLASLQIKKIGKSTFSHMRQFDQKLVQLLLAFGELSTAAVIHAKAVHDAVDDQEPVIATGEFLRKRIEQFELMLAVECASVGNVLLSRLRVNTETFRYLGDTFRSECPLRVNVGDFALSTSHFFGELCDDGHGVGQLGLATAKLAVHLADAHALESTGWQLIRRRKSHGDRAN